MPNYGTSDQQLLLMQQMEIARLRQMQGNRAEKRGPTSSTAIDRYMEEEYERQVQNKRAQWLQKKSMWPGMIATTAARTKDLDKKIAASAKEGWISKVPTGGVTPDELTQQILNIGGGAYLGTAGLANVSSIKRRAAQKRYEQQLGGLGKAERAIGNLSQVNRVAAQMRVASLIAGKGMPTSVQGSMGLYGSSMAGMLPFMGAQIGLAIWKSARIRKIKAQRTPGGEKAAKIADPIFNTLDEQINILSQKQGIKPGESILYQALRFIGTQVAVNPLIYEELSFIRDEKEKGSEALKGRYGEQVEGEGERDPITRLLDATTGALDKTLAKYDIGTQLFNFFTTGQLPRTMQQNLEAVWEKQGMSKEDVRIESRSRGITMDQHRLGMTTSRMLIDMAPNIQMQEVSLLSGIYDTNRYILLETEMIRRGGFGVTDAEYRQVDYNRSAMGKVWEAIKEGGRVITNIPGINAIANMLTLPFRAPSKVLAGFEKFVGGIQNLLVGKRTADLLSSEEELQKAAGIYRSPQEAANEYLSQGLPNINEEIRMLNAVQAQLLTNVYQVASKHLELATGAVHTFDNRPFAKEVKKGAWSMTAGKYLSEIGLKEQGQRDQDRMEVALEKSFKGSFADIMSFVFGGRDRTVFQRLEGASGLRRRLEMLPFLRTQAAETFDPQQLMQAAMFRQRGIRSRDVREAQFFDPALERRIMSQRDIGQRAQRFFGRGAGGMTALLGGAAGIGGALTGGLGLLPMVLLGALGLGTGAITPAQIRKRQAERVFGETDTSGLGYLGVRSRTKRSLGREGIRKVESVIGPKPNSWYENPANQAQIAAILGSADVTGLTGGTFQTTGLGTGNIPRAISAISMSIEQLKKDPLPVIIMGFAGRRLGAGGKFESGKADDYTDAAEYVRRKVVGGEDFTSGEAGFISKRPDLRLVPGGNRSVSKELVEAEQKQKETVKTKREEAQIKLSQQSAESLEAIKKFTEKTSKAVGKGKEAADGIISKLSSIMGTVVSTVMSSLPMLISGGALAGLSFLTGGAIGTKALSTMFGKGMASFLKGPGLRAGAKLVGRGALKSIIKKVPFLGFAAGLVFGVKRMLKGDWWGGLLEIGSGLVSMVPLVGTLGSLGIDAYLLKRDLDDQKMAELAEKRKGKDEVRHGPRGDVPTAAQAAHERFKTAETELYERSGEKEREMNEYQARLKAENPELWARMQAGNQAQQEKKQRWIEQDRKFWGWFSEKYKNIREYQNKLDQGIAEAVAGREARERYQSEWGWMNTNKTRHRSGGLITAPSVVGEFGKEELVLPMDLSALRRIGKTINAEGIRNELAARIDYIQDTSKQKEKEGRSNASMKAMNKPSMIPIPMSTGDEGRINKDKVPTAIDYKLDSFLGQLLSDCSFEFGNRYKKYVYDSNIGFSFA